MVKIACQSLVFGADYADTESMLDVIRDNGFHGVEFAQSPRNIYGGHYKYLRDALRERQLELVGLSGGTVAERIQFLSGDKHPYLYAEAATNAERQAINLGYRVALHPHAYKSVHCLDEAASVMAHAPGLRWLPDTAHFAIVGDDIVDGIFAYANRLAAIHLKDWTPIYGRVSHRYAKGFTELGRGMLPLDEVVAAVQAKRSLLQSNWLVYEQDYTQTTPCESLRISSEWLRSRGLIEGRTLRRSLKGGVVWPPPLERSACPNSELELIRAIHLAQAGSYHDFYVNLAAKIQALYHACLVSVASYSKSRETIGWLALSPFITMPAGIRVDDPLFDGVSYEPACGALESFDGSQLAALAQEKGATHCLALPIRNSYNPNHVRLFLHVFVDTDNCARLNQVSLKTMAQDIARATDINLDDCCTVAAAAVDLSSGTRSSTAGSETLILKAVHDAICQLVPTPTCSIFLLDADRNRLRPAYTPELEWLGEFASHPRLQYYDLKGASLTSQVYARRRPYVVPDIRDWQLRDPKWEARSRERVFIGGVEDITEAGRATMFVPIIAPNGDSLGVVRCVRTQPGRPFSDDDVAIVDTAVQAAIPYLRLLKDSKARDIAYDKLRHELKNPLVAILNNLSNLEHEISEWRKAHPDIPAMQFDYLEDCRGWADLATRLTEHLRFLSHSSSGLLPRIRGPVRLLPHVVAPVVRQLRSEFRDRGLLREQVDYRNLKRIPELFVDQQAFQEIFFNLIMNSVKYHDEPLDDFYLLIDAEVAHDRFVVRISDNGKGVEPEFQEVIFEEGVRGTLAQTWDPDGEGYGLWIVQSLLKSHGARIRLAHLRKPTEFVIELPRSLECDPSRKSIEVSKREAQ